MVGDDEADVADVERKLATVRGTLVPMQYLFLEKNLDKMRKPNGLTDVRLWVPDRLLNPMVKFVLPDKKEEELPGGGAEPQDLEYDDDDDPERDM